MLIVPLPEAKAGMKLAAAVLHPEQPDQTLLKPGFTLDQRVLTRLEELGVDVIYVDYPDLAELDAILLPSLSPAHAKLYTQIKSTVAAVQKTAQPTVGFADYYGTIRELVITVMQRGQHAVFLDLMAGRLGADSVSHAAAVSHLSLILGVRLQRYLIEQRSRLSVQHAAEVVNLGVAGMLHDVGKAKLSKAVQACGTLDPPEDDALRAEWETHPQIAYDMIRGGVESSAAVAVLQHHQHFDGTGFPALPARDGARGRLDGTRIHIFARILCAADLFDRLANDTRRNARRANVEVLHLMRTHYAHWLDPHVFAAFTAAVPPFVPGTKVGLSDGSSAVVVGLNVDDPYYPPVRRVLENGDALEKEKLALASLDAPQIVSIGRLNVSQFVPERRLKKRACA
jgi:hypothetical protein